MCMYCKIDEECNCDNEEELYQIRLKKLDNGNVKIEYRFEYNGTIEEDKNIIYDIDKILIHYVKESLKVYAEFKNVKPFGKCDGDDYKELNKFLEDPFFMKVIYIIMKMKIKIRKIPSY